MNSRRIALLLGLSIFAACAKPETERQRSEQGVATLVARAERADAERDLDGAIAAYAEAYQVTPWNERLESALVAAYARRAAHTRATLGGEGLHSAEEDLRAALELRPDDSRLRHNLGVVLVEQALRTDDPVRAGAMREEARSYAPDVVEGVPDVQVSLERQLDLAYDLIGSGHLDAALQMLEGQHAKHPEHAATTALLARARVRKGTELAEQGDVDGAADAFAAAIKLYGHLGQCQTGSCERAELSLAHENRIRLLLHAGRMDAARAALEDAEGAGVSLPELHDRLSPPSSIR